MRKWHRWLSLFFGVFMIWMAATGVLSHVADLWPGGAPEGAQAIAAPAGFVCPEHWRCSPPRPEGTGLKSMVGLFHHLHSGESFGPLGVAISLLTGVSLLFFSISGIWLYVQMWRFRKDRGLAPRWLWK